MGEKLNTLGFGYALAILASTIMLLLGILGNLGIYMSGVEAMQQWHTLFSLSIGGIILGMIEAAVAGFFLGFAFGWIYNRFV